LVPVFAAGTDAEIIDAFGPLLSDRDRVVAHLDDVEGPLAQSMRESLTQGTQGGGWDNVSWVGRWDFDLATINCPVLLWYGDDDRFAPLSHGRWLRDHLSDAVLTVRAGEGHFGICEHLDEMLAALVGPGGGHPFVD
jgi:pimeloyl-ACP methyl ester carboxylesterase